VEVDEMMMDVMREREICLMELLALSRYNSTSSNSTSSSSRGKDWGITMPKPAVRRGDVPSRNFRDSGTKGAEKIPKGPVKTSLVPEMDSETGPVCSRSVKSVGCVPRKPTPILFLEILH
jgi:hypothetical protein